jgi:hypothetical protein
VRAENSVRIDLMAESLNVGHDGSADTSFPKLGCLALQVQRADLKQSRAEGTALQRKVLGSRRVSVSPGSFRAGGAYPPSQPAAIAFSLSPVLPKTASLPASRSTNTLSSDMTPRERTEHRQICSGLCRDEASRQRALKLGVIRDVVGNNSGLPNDGRGLYFKSEGPLHLVP